MSSIVPFLFNYSTFQAFGRCSERTNNIWYRRQPYIPQHSYSFDKVPVDFFYLFLSLIFTLMLSETAKSTILQELLFVKYHEVWSTGRDWIIHLYQTISEIFMHLILSNRFWFVYIQFGRKVKIQSLEQLLINHQSNLVVPSCVTLLCEFAAFTYHVINSFLSFSVNAMLAILLGIIDFRFNIIGPQSVLRCFWKSLSFSHEIFLS